jgi:hypothetical protein
MDKISAKLIRALLAGVALMLSACAASTPAGRVAQAPGLFESLTETQKQAVREGRVIEGMTPDGVYLAWGRPDRVTRGSQNGQPYEVWRFTELQPVYYSGMGLGRGFGFGGYGWGGGRFCDPLLLPVDMGPDYVPVTAAVVRFVRNRVVSWERLR